MEKITRRRFTALLISTPALLGLPAAARAQTASPVASPVASPAPLDAAMVTGNWVARANDQRNGQVTGDALQGAPKLLWSTNVSADAPLPPAAGDHIVIVPTAFSVNAIDESTGEVLWHAPLDATGSAPSLVDGTVYIGSLEGLVALDARDGSTKWSFVPSQPADTPQPDGYPPLTIVDAPAAVADGIVFASGGIYGGLWALDAGTGKQIWAYDTKGGMPAVVALADGVIYLTSDFGPAYTSLWNTTGLSSLQAVDAKTGKQLWRTDFPDQFTSFAAPVVLNGMVLAGISNFGNVYSGAWNAYDATSGDLLWTSPTPSPPWSANASAIDGVFFVPGAEATGIRALDAATGKVIWTHETSAHMWWGSLIVGDVLYVRPETPSIEALDTATGALLWSIPTGAPGQNPNSGLSFSNNVLYAGSGPFAYAIAGDGGTAPAAGPSGIVTLATVAPGADQYLQWAGTLQTTEAFSGPEGIAVRPSNGEIFVVDSKNDQFQIFSSDGTFDRVWGGTGSGPGQFMFHEQDGFFIGDAEFGSDGSLYVTDPGNVRVQVFDPDLKPVRSIMIPNTSDVDMSRPGGLALDEAHNRLYVTDFAHGNLFVFDLGGTLVETWGADGAANTMPLTSPSDVEIGLDGNIVVTDALRGQIRTFTPDGQLVSVLGSIGTEPGQFVGLNSVAYDPDGNVYLTDYINNRVQVIAPDGTVIGLFGVPGSGDGQLQQPTYLTLLPDGRLLVSDETNNRVVILTTPNATPMATPMASPAA